MSGTPAPTYYDSFNDVADTAKSVFTIVAVLIVVGALIALATISYCIYHGHKRTKRQEEEQRLRRQQQQQIRDHEESEPHRHILIASPVATTYDSSMDTAVVYAQLVPSAPKQSSHSRRKATEDPSVALALQIEQQQRELDRYARDRHAPRPTAPTGSSYASQTPPPTAASSSAGSSTAAAAGPWDDPVIIASRIPMDSLFTHTLLSTGGYGQVYTGTYAGEPVAIKKLLPATRRDLAHIATFFAEVKLLASLDHERIVRYVGVAWDALSDASVVAEFMAGGDLRAALTQWEFVDARPQGVDAQKATIALHVAHALTYLHSLRPVVLHRDLKSKNILLDADQWSAKVADFGVSRARSDHTLTMTAGVGTALWMAPEVLLGERYGDKADVFSFGVVLCELDTHAMPYAHVREADGLPDAALLQRILAGTARVAFSAGCREDVRSLGEACVALDAAQRPTAAQVLHRIHQIWHALTRG